MATAAAAVTERIVYNPPIPFLQPIPGGDKGLRPGAAIIIKGILRTKSTSDHHFSINLGSGFLLNSDHRDNIPLHFNPRFKPSGWFESGDTDIVLNSLINNQWGKEERYANVFKDEEIFQIRILALFDYYKIAVNGKHLCDYSHRLPLTHVKSLFIDGCVHVDFIEYQDQTLQTAPPVSLSPSTGHNPTTVIEPIWRPTVPFNLPLCGFLQSQCIEIVGTPKMFASGFEINLMSGSEHYFHFRVYFTPTPAIARNNTINGNWQTEERDLSLFPFKLGATFDLHVIGDCGFIRVSVNGTHLVTFKSRDGQVLPTKVDRLNIVGDVTLQQVQLICL